MENQTLRADVLLLEALEVSSVSSTSSFILLFLVYTFILVANVGLVGVIFGSGLHQPMYMFLCSMSVNDVFGATVIVPHILRDLLLGGSPRSVSYAGCALQAFCVHLHASASHTILMIMALDRYVAICSPLRYGSIMTRRVVASLSGAAWATAFVLVVVLVGLSVRLSRCSSVVLNPFCDNASLFKLSCEDGNVSISNAYGLAYTVLLLGSSVGSVVLTYLKITVVCVSSRSRAVNLRALQTCASHLAAYGVLLASAFIIVILHRFPELSRPRKVAAVLGHVALPALNPVIYGLQIKEVRRKIQAVLQKNGAAV